MKKLTKIQIKKIKKFALEYYKKLDEPEHGIEHANRTVKLAEYLAKKENADIQIAKLGALLHQFHNGSLVEKFLKKLKIDKEIIKQLVSCVKFCRIKNISKAKTIEEKVVYDADKLQVVGPFGIIREISCDMSPSRKKKFPEALEHTKRIEKTCFETLQTKTAWNLAKQPHQFVLKFWKILDKWNKVKL
jgi:uncharacterized protein